MKVICGGRRTGRTTKLIEMAAEAEARREVSYIVCLNQKEARRIANQATSMDLNIGFPVTFDEFRHQQLAGQNIQNLFIDNAEFLLQSFTPIRIKAITITDEE